MTKSRLPKGSVGIQAFKGRLRLRLPRHIFQGHQKYLYLGLANTPENCKFAKAKADEIERDILYERFDPTLEKYQPVTYALPKPEKPQLKLDTLWEKYSAFKLRTLSPSSQIDFRRISNHIRQLPTQAIGKAEAKTIINHLRENSSPDTTRRVLMQVSAACDWAIEEESLSENPFKGASSKIRVTKNRAINPFTRQERDLILQAFEDSPHKHYAPFVRFLFLTGCRTSEAVGLQWRHVDAELTTITFSEAVVNGKRQSSTKTHKIRKFPINNDLQQLLASIRPDEPSLEAPVFSGLSGNLVNPNNFLNDHWSPIVKSLPMLYRPQYNTRHTFITLCLEAKVPIAQVASWVGNSPQIILAHYAGVVRCEVPSLSSNYRQSELLEDF